MSYTIKVSETGDFILITVHSDLDGETAMKYTAESHKLGNELGIMKFLVDLRNSRNVLMIGDNYHFVSRDLSKAPEVERRAKVAFLVSPEDHSHDFVETVMRNNGFNVALFRDMDEALDHLQSK